MRAAAIYVRISQDRMGDGLGVERQESLCRDLADRKGWPVAEVYRDNDLSAYSGKRRPGYDRLLDDLTSGVRDAVVCVDLDRLTRAPAELEAFIALADRHGVALANVSGDTDLATSDGRFKARILGAVARQESEKKSERIRRERAHRAQRGKPHPGPRRFGFRDGNIDHDPAEARLIRDAARRLLDGATLRSVAEDWDARGVRTARGNGWSVNAVRDVLTRPDIAGLRVHRGEVVGEGCWEPILDRATWERVVAMTDKRKRRAGRPPTRLLSAIAVCEVCGGAMRSTTSRGRRLYACRRVMRLSDDNCGRLSIVAEPLEGHVAGMVLHRLSGPALARATTQVPDPAYERLAGHLRDDEAALRDLANDYYVDRAITKAEFFAARAKLEDRIASTRRTLADSVDQALADVPSTAEGLGEWWRGASEHDRRRVVAAVIDRVVIGHADPHAPREFQPGRIREVIWKV